MNSNLFMKMIIIILIFLIFLIVWLSTIGDLHSWINFEPDNGKIAEGKVIDSYYDYGIPSTRQTPQKKNETNNCRI